MSASVSAPIDFHVLDMVAAMGRLDELFLSTVREFKEKIYAREWPPRSLNDSLFGYLASVSSLLRTMAPTITAHALSHRCARSTAPPFPGERHCSGCGRGFGLGVDSTETNEDRPDVARSNVEEYETDMREDCWIKAAEKRLSRVRLQARRAFDHMRRENRCEPERMLDSGVILSLQRCIHLISHNVKHQI
jgi:hypothetical protein